MLVLKILLSVCTDSSTDTVANRQSSCVAPVNRAAWLGIVKASTLTTKIEYEPSERNYDVHCIEQDCVILG
jgi:hypothetical protein